MAETPMYAFGFIESYLESSTDPHAATARELLKIIEEDYRLKSQAVIDMRDAIHGVRLALQQAGY